MKRFLGLARIALGAAAMMAGAGVSAQTLAALPTPVAGAATVGPANPIPAWTTFCREHPAECGVNPAEPAQITLNAKTWQLIQSVNQRVNAMIEPVTDQEHWNIPDVWSLPTDGRGDCEDFQLLKRKLLAEAGLPRRAMRITVVIDHAGEGHAVLTLRTDRGDLILDNKTGRVLPWYQTGYVFVKREGQAGTAWVSLGGATSPITTANR